MKTFIRNRKGQKLAIVVEEIPSPKGLAFVMHGLGGSKDRGMIPTMAEAFKTNGYITVTFDTTNADGESDGKYENATATNYYEDLEDVIKWAQSQAWYQEPFILSGHSYGGLCTAYYAENYPKKIKALAPIATTVSGKLSLETERWQTNIKKWRESGWYERSSSHDPNVMRRLPWSHMEDRLKYNLLSKAQILTMPVLMVVGENDNSCPPNHQRLLFDILPGPKEFHLIPNAPHTFETKEHLDQLKNIFIKWINNLG